MEKLFGDMGAFAGVLGGAVVLTGVAFAATGLAAVRAVGFAVGSVGGGIAGAASGNSIGKAIDEKNKSLPDKHNFDVIDGNY